MKLDRYDRQILEVLQVDGRINNQDLADRIGLSPSPCLRRVRALEEAGLIVGYRALLDARKLGLTLMALIHISMDLHTPERFANFETSVDLLPEVLAAILPVAIAERGQRPIGWQPAGQDRGQPDQPAGREWQPLGAQPAGHQD